MTERSRVPSTAGADREVSSPRSTFCTGTFHLRVIAVARKKIPAILPQNTDVRLQLITHTPFTQRKVGERLSFKRV